MQEKDVVAFLEVARTMDKYDARKIREKLNITEEKYSSIKTYCLGKGLLLQLRVTSEGLDYILRYEEKIRVKKEEARIRNISYFFQAITIAILLITTYTAMQNASSAERSANAAEKSANYSYLAYNLTLESMVPNYANLEISYLDDDRTFFAQTIADNQTHSEQFLVCVTNNGLIDSGLVTLGWVNEEGYFDTPPCSIEFSEVPARETRCGSLCIRYYDASNEDMVPKGNVSLKLELRCLRCNKESVHYEYVIIDACVFSTNFTECNDW